MHDFEEPFEVPITNELDLHTFKPSEISELLSTYFDECTKKGIYQVRVIHGKGTGALRKGVHSLLEKMPSVQEWTWPASTDSGSWGATWVKLKYSKHHKENT